MLLRSCRHGLSSSQYSPTPKPRARVLAGFLFDEVRHAATDRVRLVRTTVMTGASAADTLELRVLRARLQ